MSFDNNKTNEPVTVVVKHFVKQGRELDYEDWAQKIAQAASRFEGFIGFQFIRPPKGKGREFVLIFKFNSYENLLAWEESEERQHWAKIRRLMEISEPKIQRYSGWDYWFTLPDSASIAPPKYKMAIITFISIYPLALFVPMALNPIIAHLGNYIFVMINAAVIVPVMSYIIMPLMVNLFRRWLYKTNDNK